MRRSDIWVLACLVTLGLKLTACCQPCQSSRSFAPQNAGAEAINRERRLSAEKARIWREDSARANRLLRACRRLGDTLKRGVGFASASMSTQTQHITANLR